MKLYHVQYDNESYYVEADHFAEAIEIWSHDMSAIQAPDWLGEEQPDSVALIHDDSVMRWLNRKGPKIICICGSSRFIDSCAIKAWELEKEGHIVLGMNLLPQNYPGVQEHHQAEAEGVRLHMDELHLRKIDLADEVLIMNVDGYIGDSTAAELEYARKARKPVSFLMQPTKIN